MVFFWVGWGQYHATWHDVVVSSAHQSASRVDGNVMQIRNLFIKDVHQYLDLG
jgi:hypothetical protein